MSWFSTGAEEADRVAASMSPKRRKNFYTKAGERATIRFLAPATASFNYKRSFVSWAKGEKMLTSYDSPDCPLVQHPKTTLQAAFGWWVIDRRVLEFEDAQSGETKKVGPRVLYFADGQRTRKQLIGLEKDLLVAQNEEREEDGKDALDIQDFNLSSYDITASKESKAPWNFTAKRPKELSKADRELIEQTLGVTYEELLEGKGVELLAEELKPASREELKGVLGFAPEAGAGGEDDGETVEYSYDAEEDTIKFGT